MVIMINGLAKTLQENDEISTKIVESEEFGPDYDNISFNIIRNKEVIDSFECDGGK